MHGLYQQFGVLIERIGVETDESFDDGLSGVAAVPLDGLSSRVIPGNVLRSFIEVPVFNNHQGSKDVALGIGFRDATLSHCL